MFAFVVSEKILLMLIKTYLERIPGEGSEQSGIVANGGGGGGGGGEGDLLAEYDPDPDLSFDPCTAQSLAGRLPVVGDASLDSKVKNPKTFRILIR